MSRFRGKTSVILLAILFTVIILLVVSNVIVMRGLSRVIVLEYCSVADELSAARELLQGNKDLSLEGITALSNHYITAYHSIDQLIYLWEWFYPKDYSLTESQRNTLAQVYSDLAKYVSIIPLDLAITADGKTVKDLAEDITNITCEIWHPLYEHQEIRLQKNIISLCADTHTAIEDILHNDYGKSVLLMSRVSIFEFFEATYSYCQVE